MEAGGRIWQISSRCMYSISRVGRSLYEGLTHMLPMHNVKESSSGQVAGMGKAGTPLHHSPHEG